MLYRGRMNPLLDARRVVVKIGSALLVDAATAQPRADWLASVAADVAALRATGKEVVLVSSGAIALARRMLGLTRKKTLRLEEKQAAAAVGQIRLAGAWAEALGREGQTAAQLLLTLEEWCGEEGQFHRAGARGAAFAPAFADLLHLLYDADILEEGAVLAWAGEKAHADAGDRAFLERAAPFVTWLREAEEESSEGE